MDKFAGFVGVLMAVIFIAVGFLEIVSILIRPVALTLRLYGNIYGGEALIESMMRMVPSLSWLIPFPFYFYELLVGLVQVLVILTLARGLFDVPMEGGWAAFITGSLP